MACRLTRYGRPRPERIYYASRIKAARLNTALRRDVASRAAMPACPLGPPNRREAQTAPRYAPDGNQPATTTVLQEEEMPSLLQPPLVNAIGIERPQLCLSTPLVPVRCRTVQTIYASVTAPRQTAEDLNRCRVVEVKSPGADDYDALRGARKMSCVAAVQAAQCKMCQAQQNAFRTGAVCACGKRVKCVRAKCV